MNPATAAGAAAVRGAYTARRRLFHPKWGSTPRWDQFWAKTALALEREGIADAAGYVNAQFDLVKPFPRPNQLAGPRALGNYRDWLRRRSGGGGADAGEWELQARAEAGYLLSRRAVFGGGHDRVAVLDPAAPLSPLFRACCWVKLGGAPADLDAATLSEARRELALPDAGRAYRRIGVLDDAVAERIRGPA
jgi:hypothetical protein